MREDLEGRLSTAWSVVPGPDRDLVEAALRRAVPLTSAGSERSARRPGSRRLAGTALTVGFAACIVILLILGPGRSNHEAAAGSDVVVPALVGQPVADADASLDLLGLRWRDEAVQSAEPPGTVVAQEPAAGTRLPAESFVTVRFAVPAGRSEVVDGGLDVSGPTPALPRGSSLESLRGQVVVLTFVASWCEPCLPSETTPPSQTDVTAPIPVLATLASGFGSRGAAFVPVMVNDPKGDERTVVPENTGLPVVTDPEGALAARLQVGAPPAMVVLDREGRIAWRRQGLTSAADVTGVLDALAREPLPSSAAADETPLPLAVLDGPPVSRDELPASLLPGASCAVDPDRVYLLGRSSDGTGFYLARGPNDWVVHAFGGAGGCGPARDLLRNLTSSPAAMIFGLDSPGGGSSTQYIIRDGYDTAIVAGKPVPIINNALLLEGKGRLPKNFVITGPAGRARVNLR